MTPAPGWKDTGSDYLSRRRARRGDSGGWGTAAVPSEGNGTATPSGWGSGTGARAGDPAGLDATGWGSMAQGSTAIAGTQSPVRRFEGSPRLPLTTLALVLVGGLGLGICVRQFLASIDIVGWIVSGAPLFSGALLVVVVLLGLVAVAGVVLAIVVLFRRPPRWVGAALLAASLLLPLCASWGGANSGYIAFQRGLLWDVRTQASSIEPETVENVYDSFESYGVVLPAKQEVLEMLDDEEAGTGAQGTTTKPHDTDEEGGDT
ncbi:MULTISPECIES: hypothetical protein [Brachybacterium]|nr:hypothetical protein [Brachybacterium sp. JB7]